MWSHLASREQPRLVDALAIAPNKFEALRSGVLVRIRTSGGGVVLKLEKMKTFVFPSYWQLERLRWIVIGRCCKGLGLATWVKSYEIMLGPFFHAENKHIVVGVN